MSLVLDVYVDVVLLTLNSMQPCLKECVESIYKNIPLNTLIVVDGGSTDGTVKFLKTFPNIKIIENKRDNRAIARQIGIAHVQTEWFVSIDSDVILSNNWFSEAWKKIRKDTGAIQGISQTILDKEVVDFAFAMKQLTKKNRVTPQILTGDALIRASLVKNIKIPSHLHYGEDKYIQLFIEEQGYKWQITEPPSCKHIKTVKALINDAFAIGYFNYKVGTQNLTESVLALMTIFPKVIYAFVLTRNPKLIIVNVKIQFKCSLGALKCWSMYKRPRNNDLEEQEELSRIRNLCWDYEVVETHHCDGYFEFKIRKAKKKVEEKLKQ